jgi:uncharacterized membrane protein
VTTRRHTVTISRSAGELYDFWRNFENLPVFMRHLDEVTTQEDGRSHWVTYVRGGEKVEWDTEIVADVPGELIAWQSLPHGDVRDAGTVRFIPVPAGQATVVHVELDETPPPRLPGAAAETQPEAEAGRQVRDVLWTFKSVMESGQIPSEKIAISSRRSGTTPSS